MESSSKTEFGKHQEAMDPDPDIHALFCHYNALYFQDALSTCVVSWSSSPPVNRCTGTCDYHPEGGCEIRLSELLLKFRSTADLKNTLLHEMIHAFLWIKNENRDHSNHGASFQAQMNSINSSSMLDHQKPFCGYNITIYHDFHKEVDSNRVYHWICESCGDLIQRTINREPSASDCIENVSHDESCGNPSCQWHRHKKLCSGSYTKKAESSGYKDERTSSKGEQELQKNKGLHCRRSTRRSCKKEGMEDSDEKAITITNFFPSEGDANRNSGCNSSGGDSQRELLEDSKAVVLKDQGHAVAPEIPKRVRAPVSKKKHIYTGRKRRKCGKRQNEYNVIIKWLEVYADEEAEEDAEPLINKRTERRKKQKLLKNLKVRAPEDEAMDDVSPSNTSSCRRTENTCAYFPLLCRKSVENCRPAICLEDKMEEHGIPIDVDSEQVPGKIHAHAEDSPGATEMMENTAPCQPAHDSLPLNVSGGRRDVKSQGGSCEDVPPLNSPVRGDIVDISDG